jgi:hypothetical protein
MAAKAAQILQLMPAAATIVSVGELKRLYLQAFARLEFQGNKA